ncbi:Ig-like domain-containing protein [Paenibacillus lautus]|uniref:Ig-like domain-containing protein n=1 Tax=Paenibacillus lautus TaxID=1401 RepID=UPI003D278AC1
MKKKGGMLALIVILMFQGIFGTGLGTFNGQRVSAAGAGNPDPGRVELGSDAILLYDWELDDNHNYVDGSTFEFDLPKAFKLYNSIDGVLETDIGDVGTFTVSVDGHVVMTFNSLVDNAEVRGTLKFQTELSQEGIGGGTPDVEIPIELRDSTARIAFRQDQIRTQVTRIQTQGTEIRTRAIRIQTRVTPIQTQVIQGHHRVEQHHRAVIPMKERQPFPGKLYNPEKPIPSYRAKLIQNQSL